MNLFELRYLSRIFRIFFPSGVLIWKENAYLCRNVLECKIKRTIFSMPLNKSPGPDGYSVEFIRASWDTVGSDVVAAVGEFFRNGKLL